MGNGAQRLLPRWVAVTALAVGIAGGSYGIASAASGSSNNSSSGGTATAAAATPSAPSRPWGGQRSDETPLTGDALAKVTAAAKAKVPGGQVIRVETDADGNAAYEAHMTDAGGAPVTVYVSKDYRRSPSSAADVTRAATRGVAARRRPSAAARTACGPARSCAPMYRARRSSRCSGPCHGSGPRAPSCACRRRTGSARSGS